MPELAEVETARRSLTRWTVGATVQVVEVLDARIVFAAPTALQSGLIGHRVDAWDRVGKQLVGLIGGRRLLAHLGMTGRWRHGPGESRYACFRLHVEDASGTRAVTYEDPRRFGEIALVSPGEAAAKLALLGPDAWDAPLTTEALYAALQHTRRPLKTALMDQRLMAGLGNIAVIDAAFRARVHPHRAANLLGLHECERLLQAIRDHLATLLAEADTDEDVIYLSDGAVNPFLVYGRKGHPCPACGFVMSGETLGGRPSVWCSRCQSS